MHFLVAVYPILHRLLLRKFINCAGRTGFILIPDRLSQMCCKVGQEVSDD